MIALTVGVLGIEIRHPDPRVLTIGGSSFSSVIPGFLHPVDQYSCAQALGLPHHAS